MSLSVTHRILLKSPDSCRVVGKHSWGILSIESLGPSFWQGRMLADRRTVKEGRICHCLASLEGPPYCCVLKQGCLAFKVVTTYCSHLRTKITDWSWSRTALPPSLLRSSPGMHWPLLVSGVTTRESPGLFWLCQTAELGVALEMTWVFCLWQSHVPDASCNSSMTPVVAKRREVYRPPYWLDGPFCCLPLWLVSQSKLWLASLISKYHKKFCESLICCVT